MKINRILKGFGAATLIMAGLIACEDKLEEQYLNPERTTEGSIGKFLTRMIDNRRLRPDYWNVRTFLVMHPGVYTNSVSYVNTTKRYQQQLNYLDDFWKDFYTPNGTGAGGIIPHMREIERLYNGLTDDEKVAADPYLHAARIITYDQTSQMVDLWGDIPYSEAGMLNLTGETTAPKFDSGQEIYAQLLNGLEESAAYFSNASLDPLVASAFSKQDILLQGNLDKWERLANSLRLRLLMRISFQDENRAKTEVLEMLNTPASYPLLDESTFNVLLTPLTTYTDNMRNALTEVTSHLAPEFLLEDVLKPANDPRIRVLFDKNVSGGVQNADYNSMPADAPSSVQETNIAAGKYAVLDSATFINNTQFPGILMTASEVNFLKAEALERWGSTADAQMAYEKAVTQSVDFMFYLNASNTTADDEAPVTAEEKADLLAAPTVVYAGTQQQKLEKIWTQKWVSFGFIQSIQSWAEVRRTKYPMLEFVTDNSTPGSELPPSRLLYPGSEKTYNAENFSNVSSKDTPNTKIFWDVK
jgi:hypothetical protein